MESTTRSSDTVPNFVKGRTSLLLRREMVKKNNQLGGSINYFAIVFDPVKKMHYAWYYESPKGDLDKELNDEFSKR